MNRLFVFIWKHKSCLLGALGIFIAWVWNGLWTSGILFRRWQDLYGFMPDHIFFPGEEFIVLNAHDNSWLPSLGFLVLAVVSIIVLPSEKTNLWPVDYYFHIFFYRDSQPIAVSLPGS